MYDPFRLTWLSCCDTAASAYAHAMACLLLEQPTELLLLVAATATSSSVGQLSQANHVCWDELRTLLATKRMPHDARMARKSAMRCAMLLSGPCPFQASGPRRFRCCSLLSDGASCGAVISATPEEGAAHPVGVALFIKMLRHAQLEHVAEYGQLLCLFNGHAHKAVQRRGLD